MAGWGPSDLQAAYDLPSSSKGSGQVVAIVDAYDNPNVASDLAAASGERRLRACIADPGASELREYLRSIEGFTLEDRLERIACPTLVCAAERDQLSATAQSLYDALRCPKTFIPFAAADGAADHCEILNRSLFNRRAIDWLDENL